VAYADDIALLVTSNTRNELIETPEHVLDTISQWAHGRRLRFSKEKLVIEKKA